MINKQTSILNGVGTQKTHINSEHVFEETEKMKAKWCILDIMFPVFPLFLVE